MIGRLAISFALTAMFSLGVAHADKDRARAAYKRGTQHYNLTEYREALDAFKEAYREFEEPSLLFNIGQCHRQLGDRGLAIRFFKNYLNGVPNAPNREDVLALIATLEKELEQASKGGPPQGTIAPPETSKTVEPPQQPQAQTATPAPVVVAVKPTAAAERRRVRPWVWGVVAGVAVVAVGLGVGLGVGLQPHDPTPSLGSVTKD